VQIRPAELSDAAALMAIYNPVVETSTATFDLVPRTLDEQRAWLADRSGARIVLVAEDDTGTVVGYAGLSPYRDRAAYATTVEDSVYVHPDHHGRGVGRLLLGALLDAARAHGFHAVMARIVADHEASIALHSVCGFEVVGHEREVGRKFGRWLDVTLMERLL
jgi:L-amino acid N-acyltransferase YncA